MAASLQPGQRLGPYEIRNLLGEGGMGEVYRARDTRLDRSVAIKICKEGFSERFERESRAVAALNHPNIAALYDVGHNYLVMECVAGEPVHGPMPIERALEYAVQIASALNAAHRAGIIHRDLKPANILATRSGVKLLDFGLARTNSRSSVPSTSESPTIRITREHTIIGTPQYMSPEQIEGREADARSDIFSFGCVFYEMLTGRRAFEGESVASVAAAVLKSEPVPVPVLQPGVPAALDRVIRKCLAKDPDERWQTSRDLHDELVWLTTSPVPSTPARPPGQAKWMWAAAALAVLITAGGASLLWGWYRNQAPVQFGTVRFLVHPPAGADFTGGLSTVPTPQFAISPDGRHLAFAGTPPGGTSRLWVRALGQPSAVPLPDTDDASYPFWSPDSLSIGFFAEGKLKRVRLRGGGPQMICDAPTDFRGGTWNSEGTILFSLSNQQIFRVSAAGGLPLPATRLDTAAGDGAHRWPVFLPDGRHFLYLVKSEKIARRGIHIGSLDNAGFSKRLVDSAHRAIYAAPGYIVYTDGPNVVARTFDSDRLELAGEPMVISEQSAGASNSWAAISASSNGVLGHAAPMVAQGRLTWFGRDGRVHSEMDPAADYPDFRISPDGNRVVISRQDAKSTAPDIWMHDLTRATLSRFTAERDTDASPLWDPSGAHFYFRSNRNGLIQIYRQSAEGSTPPSVIFSAEQQRAAFSADGVGFLNTIPADVSSDGRFLVYNVTTGPSAFDLWLLPLNGDKTVGYLRTPFNEIHPSISPDGKWLAYASDETGRYEVYIESFPAPGAKIQISSQGGWDPRWSRDGRELFYIAPDRSLMSVELRPGSRPSAPKALFPTRVPPNPNVYRRSYDVAPDGQRFLINTLLETSTPSAITVVLNWHLDAASRD